MDGQLVLDDQFGSVPAEPAWAPGPFLPRLPSARSSVPARRAAESQPHPELWGRGGGRGEAPSTKAAEQ